MVALKRWQFAGLFAVAAAVVIALSVGLGQKLLADPAPARCNGHNAGPVHQVVFKNNQLRPVHLQANLCDQIKFTNAGPTARIVAFGPHEHHTAYDGITEQRLNQGQSLTVTLVKAGTFDFHDHLHDELAGTFTVKGAN